MSGYNLNFSVTGSALFCTETVLAADSVEFVNAVFSFDSSWNGLAKTATFRMDECVYHVPLEADSCLVPHEVLCDGVVFISVFGVSGNTRATTVAVPLQVAKSGYTVCTTTTATLDPYNYFIDRVTGLKADAVTAAGEAETAKDDAVTAQTAAETAESAAETAKDTAVAAQGQAQQAAAQAQQAASMAGTSAATAAVKATLAASYSESAADSADTAQATVLNQLESHNAATNTLAHQNILTMASEAKAIAQGKACSLSFATKADLDSWLAGTYTRADGKLPADLLVGDNLYIVALDTPDYWWDGTQIQPLGAEQPDLSDYYTKTQIDASLSNLVLRQMSSADYAQTVAAGTVEAGAVYFIYEE